MFLGVQTRAKSDDFSPVTLKPTHNVKYYDVLIPEKKIFLPFNYISEVVGKSTRPRLLTAFNYWLQIPHEKLDAIQEISEILHNYLILIDDIEDDSVLRRGIPVAQSIFGVGTTLNAANYSAFLALQKAIALGSLQGVTICIEDVINIHRGVGIELYWREIMKCPSEEEYYKMTLIKNYSTLQLPFRLMQLFTKDTKDYTKFLLDYSLYIQIKDDYTDLFSEDRLEYKHYCEDIAEGKFPFPIVHAINKENDERIISLIRKKPKSMEMKKYAMTLLERHGSYQYTLDTLKKFDKTLREEVFKLGGNPKFEAILDEYAYLFD